MSFKMMFPEAILARVKFEHAIVMAFYARSDEGLAFDLLGLCNNARHQRPDVFRLDSTYDAVFLKSLVPELARRLGADVSDEKIDPAISAMTPRELRLRTGYALENMSPWGSDSLAWQRLTREPANGNPVVYALDRLCPGVHGDREDIVVRRLTEIARCRGTPFTGVWTLAVLSRHDQQPVSAAEEELSAADWPRQSQ